jgi:hypothetical protein
MREAEWIRGTASFPFYEAGPVKGLASDGFTLLSAVPRIPCRMSQRDRIHYATTAHSPEQAFERQ